MFDYSQIYLTPHPDVHASPNLSPKAAPEPTYPALHPPAFEPQRASPYPSELESITTGSDNERVFSSGDEDSMGFHSDTIPDSVSQSATMSGDPGVPDLEAERLFVALPPSEITKQSLLPLGEVIPTDHAVNHQFRMEYLLMVWTAFLHQEMITPTLWSPSITSPLQWQSERIGHGSIIFLHHLLLQPSLKISIVNRLGPNWLPRRWNN